MVTLILQLSVNIPTVWQTFKYKDKYCVCLSQMHCKSKAIFKCTAAFVSFLTSTLCIQCDTTLIDVEGL